MKDGFSGCWAPLAREGRCPAGFIKPCQPTPLGQASERAAVRDGTVSSFSQRASAPVPSGEQVVPLYLAPQVVQLELDLLLKLHPLPLLGHRLI